MNDPSTILEAPISNMSIFDDDNPSSDAHDLIADLYQQSKVKRSIRATTYKHSITHEEITSWKFNEWEYKIDPCPFPILARGLFTQKIYQRYSIVARGYDKFFNIGEIKKTEWPWIEKNTTGPYEITLKENGCIIFISVLPLTSALLVTSKHALRGKDDTDGMYSHAQKGEEWCEKHLARVGKTKQDLAAWLKESNATMVFELCDDTFEEHILAYDSSISGLYLHGINYNGPNLITKPSKIVQNIAKEWGFHTTKFEEKDTVQEVKSFTDALKELGQWNGRSIEGFVIRCKIKDSNDTFFFKIKFDQPYLMYREWREITKVILSGKESYKIKYRESSAYAEWVKGMIKKEPKLFATYQQNLGIIKVRERFLEWWEKEGREQSHNITESKVSPPGEIRDYKKTVLITIASIGCGKTTISLALEKLFGFGHVQNDNITARKNPNLKYYKAVCEVLDKEDIVIADRNNHEARHRQELTEAIRKNYPDTRFVALYWSHANHTSQEIYDITSGRVIQRGENHQSLTPERNPKFSIVIRSFLNAFTPIDSNREGDSEISDVIDLDIFDDALTTLRKVCKGILGLVPDLTMPSEEEMKSALEIAKSYKPTVRKEIKYIPLYRSVKYYGIEVGCDTETIISGYVDKYGDELTKKRFNDAVDHNRIIRPGHITLIHIMHLESNNKESQDHLSQDIWDHYKTQIDLVESTNSGSSALKYSFKILALVSNDRIMTIHVELDSSLKSKSINRFPHITFSRTDNKVAMKESNTLLEALENGEQFNNGKICNIVFPDGGFQCYGTLKGFSY